jgi:group I intron endonuclease
MGDIYLLESPSNKYYIGQAVEKLCSGKNWGYLKRWKAHIREAKKGLNYSRRLDNAIRKYGSENFKVSLLCKCSSIQELNEMEVIYIEKYNSLAPNGYNLTTGGNNLQKQSEETKLKKSQSLIGKNKGRSLQKRPRIDPNDNFLPKYVRKVKNGYRISNHPSKVDKCFRSTKISMDEKLNLTLNELKKLDELVKLDNLIK